MWPKDLFGPGTKPGTPVDAKPGQGTNTADLVALKICEREGRTWSSDISIVEELTYETVIGKRVRLEACSDPEGKKVTNVRWEIDGDTVKDFGWDSEPPYAVTWESLARAGNRNVSTDNPVVFYWITKGTQLVVKVTAEIEGRTVQCTERFDVAAPKVVEMKATMGKIALHSRSKHAWIDPEDWIDLGDPGAAVPGVTWHYAVEAPEGCEGEMVGLTLVQWKRTAVAQSDDRLHTWALSGEPRDDWHLATRPPLRTETSKVFVSQTVPGKGVKTRSRWETPSGHGAVAPTATASQYLNERGAKIPLFMGVSVDDSYQTYLMYRPSGESAASIWVSLARIDWGWSATAERGTNLHWDLVKSHPATPFAAEFSAPPYWTSVVTPTDPHESPGYWWDPDLVRL